MITLSQEQSDKYLVYSLNQSNIEARLQLKNYKPIKEQLRGVKLNIGPFVLLACIMVASVRCRNVITSSYFTQRRWAINKKLYMDFVATSNLFNQ
jgi:hypothetical protein